MTKIAGYWTTGELAEATGLSQNTVRHHCSTGRLKGQAQWTETEWLVPDAAAQTFIALYPSRRTPR